MIQKVQVKSLGQFTQEQKKDGTGTYLQLPVTLKVGQTSRFVIVDQMTGATEKRDFDELVYDKLINNAAQETANLNLQVGEMVMADIHYNINTQFQRTDIRIARIWREQPQQGAAPQQGNAPW